MSGAASAAFKWKVGIRWTGGGGRLRLQFYRAVDAPIVRDGEERFLVGEDRWVRAGHELPVSDVCVGIFADKARVGDGRVGDRDGKRNVVETLRGGVEVPERLQRRDLQTGDRPVEDVKVDSELSAWWACTGLTPEKAQPQKQPHRLARAVAGGSGAEVRNQKKTAVSPVRRISKRALQEANAAWAGQTSESPARSSLAKAPDNRQGTSKRRRRSVRFAPES